MNTWSRVASVTAYDGNQKADASEQANRVKTGHMTRFVQSCHAQIIQASTGQLLHVELQFPQPSQVK